MQTSRSAVSARFKLLVVSDELMRVTCVTGDWAGNSYATSGCPGTCPDRLMDPANFVVCVSNENLEFQVFI